MSMPRAAMSVATSTRAWPALKRASARSRAFCDLLPWMASASMPRFCKYSATRLAVCFVCVKTSARVIDGSLSRSAAQRRPLVVALDEVDALLDPLGRRRHRRHRHRRRVAQDGVGELLGLGRHGGREEQRLPLVARRQMRDHAAHVVDEAHVEHAVGFVEDEDLELVAGARCAAASDRAGGPAWPPGCRGRRGRRAPERSGRRRRRSRRACSRGACRRRRSPRRSARPARASASARAPRSVRSPCGRRPDGVRAAAGSAARRRPSCRCRSVPGRAGHARRGRAGSPAAGSASASV